MLAFCNKKLSRFDKSTIGKFPDHLLGSGNKTILLSHVICKLGSIVPGSWTSKVSVLRNSCYSCAVTTALCTAMTATCTLYVLCKSVASPFSVYYDFKLSDRWLTYIVTQFAWLLLELFRGSSRIPKSFLADICSICYVPEKRSTHNSQG